MPSNTIVQKNHKLYDVAFGAFREKARALSITLKRLVKMEGYSGKVLRRGTHGAFGFDARPLQSAKTNRRGCNAPGNSYNRRFARRHPQHFSPVSAQSEPELDTGKYYNPAIDEDVSEKSTNLEAKPV